MSRKSARVALPIPLSKNMLTVLAWFAEWTPPIHKLDWRNRRTWPPGFRYMADASSPYGDNKLEDMVDDESYPPTLPGETGIKRNKARALLSRLLAYRLIEGAVWSACRLTARGRAALLTKGMECPSSFETHCKQIFDDHSLLPRKGVNVRLDMDDTLMQRLPEAYRVGHKELLPDDSTTWTLMLEEYGEDTYRASGSLNGCSVRMLETSTTGRFLNGSLRKHHRFISVQVTDEDRRVVCEMALSLEGLADMLVSNHNVPITLDSFTGPDGMRRSLPIPPPVSVTRRMEERIGRGNQDLRNRLESLRQQVDMSNMGKRLRAALLSDLDIAIRDCIGHGAWATQQAMEELSSVAESMVTIMHDKAALATLEPAALLGPPEEGMVGILTHDEGDA